MPRVFFLYFFLWWRETSPRQSTLSPPLGSKPQIYDPTHQNYASNNLGKLLVRIKTRKSRSIDHPKPQTTRLHSDGCFFSLFFPLHWQMGQDKHLNSKISNFKLSLRYIGSLLWTGEYLLCSGKREYWRVLIVQIMG